MRAGDAFAEWIGYATSTLLRCVSAAFRDAGRQRQDFHGACLPDGPQRQSKEAMALADGIGSSDVSDVAAAAAVTCAAGGLLDCTSDAWSVKARPSAWWQPPTRGCMRKRGAALYHFDQDRGYVCTLSALIVKGGHGAPVPCGRYASTACRAARWSSSPKTACA